MSKEQKYRVDNREVLRAAREYHETSSVDTTEYQKKFIADNKEALAIYLEHMGSYA
tara:strand:+ start:830 stop:997 length:168 start_codon:yes stop_codon:yes gene_type:complete